MGWLLRRKFSGIKPGQKWPAVMTHCQPFLSWSYSDEEKSILFMGFCLFLLLCTPSKHRLLHSQTEKSERVSQLHLLSSGSAPQVGAIAYKSGVLWNSEKSFRESFEIPEWAEPSRGEFSVFCSLKAPLGFLVETEVGKECQLKARPGSAHREASRS